MKHQSGIVSMITSIMVSMMLIVSVLGLTILVNSSAGQASDDELSLRAYAGAEAGVEWVTQWGSDHDKDHPGINYSSTTPECTAILTDAMGPADGGAIYQGTGVPIHKYYVQYPKMFTFNAKNYLDTTTTQNPVASYQNAITCLKVTNKTDGSGGELTPNTGTASTQVKVPPTSAGRYLANIRVEWVGNSDVQPTHPWEGTVADPLPAAGNYATYPADPLPAAIELIIVSYPYNTSTFLVDPKNVGIRNVVLLPSTAAGDTSSPSKKIIQCLSAPGATYTCDTGTTAGIGGVPANQGAIVFIKSRYNSTRYHLTFLDQFGNKINVEDQFAQIDVTARAGSVYRRLVAKYSVGRFSPPPGLEYVLFGDTDLCKSFSIYSTSAGVYSKGNGLNSGACPLP